jgi:hypothetical protein
VSCSGNIADVLYGASLIPNFQFFDTSYQALTGTLPDISLPNMQILDLSNNYLSVCHFPSAHARYPSCSLWALIVSALQ